MSDYINENLLGTSPYKSQAAESKKLVAKWDKTGLLDGLNEDFKKSGMAVMLENQAKQLINEATFTGGGAGGAAAGTAGSEEWSGVALPLVRRIFGEIAAQEFVSVQPMNLQERVVELQVRLLVLVLKNGQAWLFHWFVESLVRLLLRTL